MKLRHFVSAMTFAFAALPFFASGCASTEEEPSPESSEVKTDVANPDGVGLEPNICYVCFKCPGRPQQYCAWGGSSLFQCEDNCAVDCVHVSTGPCG